MSANALTSLFKAAKTSKKWGASSVAAGNKPLYYSFTWNNIHFVALSDKHSDWGDTISEEQLPWFEEELAANCDKTTVIFSHQPVSHTITRNQKYFLDRSGEIKELLKDDSTVKIWFSGHHHLNHSYKPSTFELDGVLHVNVDAPYDRRNNGTYEMRVVAIEKTMLR